MRRALFIIFSMALIYTSSTAQDTSSVDSVKQERKNVVYLELLGSGFVYSLNYERRLFQKTNLAIYARIGLSYIFYNGSRGVIIPTGVSILHGKRKGKIESGLGITNVAGREEAYHTFKPFSYLSWVMNGILGYRYQSDDGGIVFRISYVPYYDPTGDNSFGHRYVHWAGVSIGFKL